MTSTLERVQPRMMVRGHVHPGSGRYRHGMTEVIKRLLVDATIAPSTRRLTQDSSAPAGLGSSRVRAATLILRVDRHVDHDVVGGAV